MSKNLALAGAIAASVALAGPAAAQAADTVTAQGNAQVRVVPTNRHSNASIAAAVAVAKQAGIGLAIADAQKDATKYATALGWTLGSPIAISDQASANGYFGVVYGVNGTPFGQGKYCGTFRRGQVVKSSTGRKVVKFKKVHTCIVPGFEETSLVVTYSAS